MKRAILITSLLILFIGCKKVEIENEDYEQFKEKEMAVLPATNLTTSMVRNALGESSNSVGALCTSDKINPWSPRKPAHIDGVFTKTHGLYRDSNNNVYYKLPLGGADSPYRLGDFRGYNHDSKPPVIFELTDIRLVAGPTVQTPVAGGEYSVTYRFKRGAINPASISENTRWEKPVGDGFGGIAIIHAGLAGGISDAQVYNVEAEWTTIETVIITQEGQIGGPPLVPMYMKRVSGVWLPSGYVIENNFDVYGYPRWWSNIPVAINAGRVSNPIDDQGYMFFNPATNYFYFRYIHTDNYQYFTDGWIMSASAWSNTFGRMPPYSIEIRTSVDNGASFGSWESNDLVQGVNEYYYSPINPNDYWLEYGTVYEFRMFFSIPSAVDVFRFGLFRTEGIPNAFNELDPYNPRGSD